MSNDDTPIDNAVCHFEEIGQIFSDMAEAADLDQDDRYDELTSTLYEMPLEVTVRSGWVNPHSGKMKPEEYQILLSTGGPACRVTGDLGTNGEIATARLEWQDWGTPWTPVPAVHLPPDAENTLIRFAEVLVG